MPETETMTGKIELSDVIVDKARHALGLGRSKVAYRNHYSCGDDPDWDDLVARGYATKRKSPVSPDYIYHLTQQSAFFFLNCGESIGPDVRFPAILSSPRASAEGG
jgi:hypothetical protein